MSKTITILLDEKKPEQEREVKDVKVENRKTHLKKYCNLCLEELKGFSFRSFKAFVRLFKALIYGFVALGDLFLIGIEWNNKRRNNKPGEKPKKNILDEGW